MTTQTHPLATLRIGFVPLADAAPVIAAATQGFDVGEGLKIELSRANSWASLRDKLVVGLVDAAHMLAPLAMATHLGVGHLHMPLAVPLRLSLDGNVIAVSQALHAALAEAGFGAERGELARALAGAAAQRRAAGRSALTLATVFPASSHHALLRRLVAEAGLAEGADVRLVVLAPPLMVDALAAGVIDGFCAGAPWGSVAVERGIGHIAAASADFGAGRSEKLLALTQDFVAAQPELVLRLTKAVARAARWCADPANREALAALLAEPRHLGLPAAVIARSLAGRLVLHPGGTETAIPSFLTLGGAEVSRPDPTHAGPVLDEIGEAPPAGAGDAAAGLFRPDLYESAVSG